MATFGPAWTADRRSCGKCDWLDSQTKDDMLIELNTQYLTPEELQDLREELQSAIDDLMA